MDERPPSAADVHSNEEQQSELPVAGQSWLRHYSPGMPIQIGDFEHPLPWLLEQALTQHGSEIAIEYYGTRISYARLGVLVERFARALMELGVRPGDRVAICLPNVPQFPIAFYGALRAGAVAVPTNPLYTPRELSHQMKDSGTRVVVILDQFYPNLARVRQETPVERVIVTSAADFLPRPLAVAFRVKSALESRHQERVVPAQGVHQFMDLLSRQARPRHAGDVAFPEPASPSDVAVLQYTGGTTGVSKGAMLTHRGLVVNALQCWAWNEQPPGSHHRTLCVAPFFHVYGLTVAMNLSIYSGSTMLLLPRFTVKDTLKAIQRYKPDLFPGVPTMYLALAREAEKSHPNLSSIRVCISGSAPLPGEVQRRFEAVSGGTVVEGYGLTEASPVTHCNPVYGEQRLGTIGLPLPDTDGASIDPETWEHLPPGAEGEIAVRGPQVMLGYWKRPDETANVLRDGWLRTGDVGMMDADGYFTIVDRAKDIIIAGGLKVFPREVDEVLFQHPKVLEAAAVGVPDEYRGETVRAFVVPKPGERLTEEELSAFCKERLAPYKVPKQFEFREALPKTLVGKVLRRSLREEYVAHTQAKAAVSPPSP